MPESFEHIKIVLTGMGGAGKEAINRQVSEIFSFRIVRPNIAHSEITVRHEYIP